MADFRSITGVNGLTANQLGRFGEVTGGWRIARNGSTMFECDSEVDARIMLLVLADVSDEVWAKAINAAVAHMGKDTV